MDFCEDNVKTYAMDHHGIIAGLCKDLGIASKIDSRIGKKDPRRILSPGTAAVAMIINGLGFTNRRLYLTPQFFESKPVDKLFNENISAEQINDNTLGKALDEISEYGSTKLFAEIAFEIVLENNLMGPISNLDSTSMSVEGQYENESEDEVVKITYGHSKDHRPDLKQVVMSLVMNGPASVPIWMEPQNGNSSDKKEFHETIKKVRAFQKELKGCPEFKWVADSALYNKDKLLKQSDYLWVSRVPESITEARNLVEKPDSDIDWMQCENGYKMASFGSNYGDIEQRWLLIYSDQAYLREKKTFEKKLKKQDDELEKVLWHFSKEIYSCDIDGMKEANKVIKKFPYHKITFTVTPSMKHKKSGRPKSGDNGDLIGYQIIGHFCRNDEAIETMLNKKGRFILATNDLDKIGFPDNKILEEYKGQQNVERGFRFLKDPWFMVDSIFLKSPKRIEALMMIMTLCLLVYNIGQYRIRTQLKNTNETLPNQIKKPIQNPTLRWIFQIMEGIGVVHFYQKDLIAPTQKVVANISELRCKIIKLFGPTVCQIYGIP